MIKVNLLSDKFVKPYTYEGFNSETITGTFDESMDSMDGTDLFWEESADGVIQGFELAEVGEVQNQVRKEVLK